jgi:hypothetical protein
MDLLPDRLVVIKLFGAPEEAEEEQEKLNEAEIPNYLGWDGLFHRLELKVPEEDVQAAIKVLEIEEHSLDLPESYDEEAIRCPQCQSIDVKPLRPYLLIGGVLGTPVAILLAYLGLSLGPVFGSLVVIGWVSLLFWLAPRVPKWQCIPCGHRWRGISRPYPYRY